MILFDSYFYTDGSGFDYCYLVFRPKQMLVELTWQS